MQNPPPVQTTKSSTGLDENVASLLSYIFGWVSGLIFFLIEKDSRLVKFHAMQSILLNAAALILGIVLWVAWAIVAIMFAMVSETMVSLVSVLFGLVIMVFYLALLIGVILCLVKAYQKQYFKLPLIGNFAEKFSAK
jgi:uncharacterized membrane protein